MDKDTGTSAKRRRRTGPAERRLGAGPGRVLLVVYAVFVIAAAGRSSFQIATEFDRAPLAYLLSAVAAGCYLTACYALLADRAGLTRLSCTVELGGVLAIGTWSYLVPSSFPDSTVWSHYGQGYGYLPLLLPVAGLAWLRAHARTAGA